MSKIPLYILTENLKFFYRLKNGLDKYHLKFQILSNLSKIPKIPSIILTTSNEISQIKSREKNVIILPYFEKGDFEDYILNVLATYRVGFKDTYSNLTFSIDPGTKYIGMVIFLDDYYLISNTFYTITEMFEFIRKILKYFSLNISNALDVKFKIGRSLLDITSNIVEDLFLTIKGSIKLEVFLIDEISSSKVKISTKAKKFPKHEAAALLLAFREGIIVNNVNYHQILNFLRLKKIKKNDYENRAYKGMISSDLNLGELSLKVINGGLSLSEASKIINNFKLTKYENLT